MIHFASTVWRIMFAKDKRQAAQSVASLEGHFHHSGQSAIYASLTQDGCAVAIRRYLRPDDPARVILPLKIKAAKLAALRELRAAQPWSPAPGPHFLLFKNIPAGGSRTRGPLPGMITIDAPSTHA